MFRHLSRAIKGTRKLIKPNSKKNLLETVLIPKTMPKEGLQILNGSLIIPLSTSKLWGGIQQFLTFVQRS